MTDILKSFSTLQSELNVAKSTLKGVNENIKRLIGRDPSELPPRPPLKRNTYPPGDEQTRNNVNQNEERRFKNSRLRMFVQESDEPPVKKRTTGISVFKRLSDRPRHEENEPNQRKGMISKVIVTSKEIPSRQERLEAQSKDATSIARNKRMFGALLGTLQKFQQEETKLKKKEDKRAMLEKKIEEHEIKEKQEIKKERQELFYNRKKKQAEIKMIELKILRMKEYTTWEDSQKSRSNFIYTKAKPQIHYLPRKLKDEHKLLLETSKKEIQNTIDKKREQVQEELINIEERVKSIYESRKHQQDNKEAGNDEHENGLEDDELHHMENEEVEKSTLIHSDENGTFDNSAEVATTNETEENVDGQSVFEVQAANNINHSREGELSTEASNTEDTEKLPVKNEKISENKEPDNVNADDSSLYDSIYIKEEYNGSIQSGVNGGENNVDV